MPTPKKDPSELKRPKRWDEWTQEQKDEHTRKQRERNPRYLNPDELKKGRPRGYAAAIPPVTPATKVRKGAVCGAKKRGKSDSGEGICCMPAGWGTEHVGVGACKLHGGSTAGHLIKATVEEAKKQAVIYGAPLDIDPDTAIMQELCRTAGHVAWLNNIISGYQSKDDLMHVSAFGVAPDPYLKLYTAEREHLVKVAKVAKDMGISERQMQLAEDQGRMVAMALMNFLRDPDLNLTPQQQIAGRQAMRKHLEAIEVHATELTTG